MSVYLSIHTSLHLSLSGGKTVIHGVSIYVSLLRIHGCFSECIQLHNIASIPIRYHGCLLCPFIPWCSIPCNDMSIYAMTCTSLQWCAHHTYQHHTASHSIYHHFQYLQILKKYYCFSVELHYLVLGCQVQIQSHKWVYSTWFSKSM